MPTISKRRKANLAAANKNVHTPAEAVAALRKFKTPKFDQTVNVVMHLGIDPKQEYQTSTGRPVMIVRDGTPIPALVG